jgi:hypothetical protein
MRHLLRPMALLGTVALMIALTVALTLSHATHFGGTGSLKCYDLNGGKEKKC